MEKARNTKTNKQTKHKMDRTRCEKNGHNNDDNADLTKAFFGSFRCRITCRTANTLFSLFSPNNTKLATESSKCHAHNLFWMS